MEKCRLKPRLLDFWCYDPLADRPAWVVRRCHKIGPEHTMVMRVRPGFPEVASATPGDYIILDGENIMALSRQEFHALFEVVEEV
jgi:hypothetical protein